MEELHVILPRVLEWLVRCMMLRQDINSKYMSGRSIPYSDYGRLQQWRNKLGM